MCAVLFFDLRKRFSKDLIGFSTTLESFHKKMGFWEDQIRKNTAETKPGTF